MYHGVLPPDPALRRAAPGAGRRPASRRSREAEPWRGRGGPAGPASTRSASAASTPTSSSSSTRRAVGGAVAPLPRRAAARPARPTAQAPSARSTGRDSSPWPARRPPSCAPGSPPATSTPPGPRRGAGRGPGPARDHRPHAEAARPGAQGARRRPALPGPQRRLVDAVGAARRAAGKVAFMFPGLEAAFAPEVDDVAAAFGPRAARRRRRGQPAGGPEPGHPRPRPPPGRRPGRHGVPADVIAGHSLGEWTGQIVSGMIADRRRRRLPRPPQPGRRSRSPTWCSSPSAAGAEVAAELVDGVAGRLRLPRQLPPPVGDLRHRRGGALVADRARDREVMAQELPFRSGFHSPLFAPFVQGLAADFGALGLRAPGSPAVVGDHLRALPDRSRRIAATWRCATCVEPVRFRELVERLHDDGVRVFLQLGAGQPHRRSSTTRCATAPPWRSPRRRQAAGVEQLRRVAAALWAEGAPVDPVTLGPIPPRGRPRWSRQRPRSPGPPRRRPAHAAPPRHPAGPRPRAARRRRLPAPVTGGPRRRPGRLCRRARWPPSCAPCSASRPRRRAGRGQMPPAAPGGAAPPAPPAPPPPRGRAAEPVTEVHLSADEQPWWLDHAFFEQPPGGPRSRTCSRSCP